MVQMVALLRLIYNVVVYEDKVVTPSRQSKQHTHLLNNTPIFDRIDGQNKDLSGNLMTYFSTQGSSYPVQM